MNNYLIRTIFPKVIPYLNLIKIKINQTKIKKQYKKNKVFIKSKILNNLINHTYIINMKFQKNNFNKVFVVLHHLVIKTIAQYLNNNKII
jgi:hypothetical protein